MTDNQQRNRDEETSVSDDGPDSTPHSNEHDVLLVARRYAERQNEARAPAEEKDPESDDDRHDARKPEPDDDDEKSAGAWEWIKAHRITVLIIAIVIIAAIVAAILWWLHARHFENTDDAFIDGRPVAIGAQVAGAVTDVLVTDNQLVEAGAILATIDDRDYQASLAQAQAQIAQAEAGMANADAQVEAQKSAIIQAQRQVNEAQAALSFSKDENVRYQDLVQKGAGTAQRAQQAASDLQQKQASLDAAIAAGAQAEKQIAVLQAQHQNSVAQLHQAQGQRDQATANLSRVTLTSPVKGRVTRLTGARGAYTTPGQTLMMIVPLDLWVTANFKESQLADMRPNQPVTIHVDAYSRDFDGHIASIQSGSGTAFSLLPAENATGNYVKVVQRVPVKIVFEQTPDVELGPGMSVVPSVRVR